MKKKDEEWIEAWKQSKIFKVENDKIKSKSYLYSSFPASLLYGFQDIDIRRVLSGDFFSRYQRMNEYNVLFPLGFNTLGKQAHDEQKKYPTENLVEVYLSQMERLGVGVDTKHYILFHQKEFISSIQLAFIELYQKKWIDYQEMPVLYDSKKKQIYEWMDNQYTSTQEKMVKKSFYLDISSIIDQLVLKIDALPTNDEIKKELYSLLLPQKSIVMNFMVTNGTKIRLQFKEPQYMGGISFILIHPDEVDFTIYSSASEASAIEKYLSEDNNNDFGVFTGNYAINPLTGKRIPIFISVLHDCPIYVANPYLNKEDRQIALDEMLPVIDVVQNGVFIESDFLNGVDERVGKEMIIKRFLEAEMCEVEHYYSRDKILLSSLDVYGVLYPFLSDEDGKLYSLKQNLPITLTSKLNMILSDVPVNKINGSIQMGFIKGILPLIAILYDEIGGSGSIFSKEAIRSYQMWDGIDLLMIHHNELMDSVLIPLCIMCIIEKEKAVELPSFCHHMIVTEDLLDTSETPICRLNNNLINFKQLLNQYSPDAIRCYFLSKPLDQSFVYNEAELRQMENVLKEIDLYFDANLSDSKLSIDDLIDQCQVLLDEKKVVEYVNLVLDYFKNTLFKQPISSKQGIQFLKLLYPMAPFLAENIYYTKFKGKYLISSLGWTF